MKGFFARARSSVAGIALVAVLAIASVATANRSIRDNTINTRDIKDNQVNTRDLRNGSATTRDIRDNQINTRDLRDGAIRGVDVHDGSLGLADLSPEASGLVGSATLFDPRAHGASGCCLSWARGPEAVVAVTPASGDPIPGPGDGQAWRSAVLDPGTYVVQATAEARKADAGAEAVATRLFLGGKPAGDRDGYLFAPVAQAAYPISASSATVIQVGAGDEAQRRLTQQAVSLGGMATLEDDLLIWRVTPR